jgi:hypothetical protein
MFKRETIGLCIPLLAVVCALSTGGAALVTRITRDTERVSATAWSVEEGGGGSVCTP